MKITELTAGREIESATSDDGRLSYMASVNRMVDTVTGRDLYRGESIDWETNDRRPVEPALWAQVVALRDEVAAYDESPHETETERTEREAGLADYDHNREAMRKVMGY